MLFWISVGSAFVVLLIMHLRQVYGAPKSPKIAALALVDAAQHRTIIVGEYPKDRKARDKVTLLMVHLHRKGYRHLGLDNAVESQGPWRGLDEERTLVEGFGRHAELSEMDANRSPGQGWSGERANRHWYLQNAEFFGWTPIAVNPALWRRMLDSVSRDAQLREMAAAIMQHDRMLAVVDVRLLPSLKKLLGDRCVYACASDIRRSPSDSKKRRDDHRDASVQFRDFALVTK